VTKTELRLADHSILPGQKVIEVIHGGRLLCTITGADGPGVRIVSKHIPADIVIDARMPTMVRPLRKPLPGGPGVIEVRFG
jgi:hypothetical protein